MPTLPGPTVITGGSGGGFAIGSSYLFAGTAATASGNADGQFPTVHWTLGGDGFNLGPAPWSAGSDISINGGDDTLIDFATDGWYIATLWVQGHIDSPGVGSFVGLEPAFTFNDGFPPSWGTLYAGLPTSVDTTISQVTTPPYRGFSGQQFNSQIGGYMSNPAETWGFDARLWIVRVA